MWNGQKLYYQYQELAVFLCVYWQSFVTKADLTFDVFVDWSFAKYPCSVLLLLHATIQNQRQELQCRNLKYLMNTLAAHNKISVATKNHLTEKY